MNNLSRIGYASWQRSQTIRRLNTSFGQKYSKKTTINSIENSTQNGQTTHDPASMQKHLLTEKFQIFHDKDAPIIFDINEERQKLQQMEIYKEIPDVYSGLNLERGQFGVFDIDDLVEVLRRKNGENIYVCSVPKDLKYIDYICIVSGRSNRHRKAMAQFVRKLYKIKRNSLDILPKIEGENSADWMALDLGNIALHIFSSEARQKYSLEPLWAVGSAYDDESNKPLDHVLEMYERHTLFLNDLVSKK